MNFFGSGIPLGRYFGINVRMHFTFLIYAFYRIQEHGNMLYGLAYIAGLYLCILLHEFGHALAARWCDGQADDILLWPLGGLAFCRPAWHPTAHLITSAAGPFVTFVLGCLFVGAAVALRSMGIIGTFGYWFVSQMAWLNIGLLVFNLIPAFPMDGGRILRDVLWYWLGAERATNVAVIVSRMIAGAGAAWAIFNQQYMLVLIAVFIYLQTTHERRVLAAESSGVYGFSIRDRLRRGSRKRAFQQGMTAVRAREAVAAFHRCTACGRTEHDDSNLDFRVCTDCSGGQEYCLDHLDTHPHV